METIVIQKLEYESLVAKNTLAIKLEEQVKILLNEKQELSNQNTVLVNTNKELLAKIKVLEEKILDLHQRLFGKKKDQANKDQRNIGKKLDANNKGQRGRKPIDKSKVDVTNQYDFNTTPVCSECNDPMVAMGSNDSYHEDYKVVIQKVKNSHAKYVCRCCNKIVVANGSRLPIRKGLPMPGFLTQVILDKFSNGLPCYRQAQNYGYANHIYTRQMFNHWIMQGADLLDPLFKLILLNMLQSNYLAVDETGLILLQKMLGKECGGKAHMCVLKQHGEGFNFVYCWVITNRKQQVINDKLKDFKGYLQSDGLNFYFKLKEIAGIILVNCWAHVRRKFITVIKLSGQNESGVAVKAVEQIDALYSIERHIKDHKLNSQETLALRIEKAAPILIELQQHLQTAIKTTPPKSKLGIAINYTLDRWKELTEYIKNAKLDIDNNHTERCIKYIVIGRKAWLFADNIDSANKLGLLYSLIISCKINNVNPREYLEYVLTQMPYINKNNTAELEQLLPDRFNLDKKFDQEYLAKRGIVKTTIFNQNDHLNIKVNSSKVA